MATKKTQGIVTTVKYRDLETRLAAARSAERAAVFTLSCDSTPEELQAVWRLMDVTTTLKRQLDDERCAMIDRHCAHTPV